MRGMGHFLAFISYPEAVSSFFLGYSTKLLQKLQKSLLVMDSESSKGELNKSQEE